MDMHISVCIGFDFQEGGFDLDMTYITENIIAMGFPAGDLSSGFFGYVEVSKKFCTRHMTFDRSSLMTKCSVM